MREPLRAVERAADSHSALQCPPEVPTARRGPGHSVAAPVRVMDLTEDDLWLLWCQWRRWRWSRWLLIAAVVAFGIVVAGAIAELIRP